MSVWGFTEAQARLLGLPGDGLLGVAPNEHGVDTSVFRCTKCGQPFTVTPAVTVEQYGDGCMVAPCSSYDPDRDVAMLLLRGAEIHREGEADDDR